MEIKIYHQPSERKSIACKEMLELFGFVGIWLTNKTLIKKWGAPVTSEEGNIWFVAVEEGKGRGFMLLNPEKNDTCRLRFIHSPNNRIQKRLLKEAEKVCEKAGFLTLYTVDAIETETFWSEHHYTSTQSRGNFYRFEKALTE